MRTPAFWFRRGWQAHALLPLAALYGLLQLWDKRRHRPKSLPVPLVSVGNLVAGGAGKTPTTLALADLLAAQGWQPAILTRGYGRNRPDKSPAPLRVDPDRHLAEQVGDEPLLLAQHWPTWVATDRHTAGLAALEAGADILLLDDGLQHWKLKRDLDFCLVDAKRGLGNGWLLPAGPLREPARAGLARSQALVRIGTGDWQLPAHLPQPPHLITARLVPAKEAPAPQPVVGFAGLAHPHKFHETLLEQGFDVRAFHALGDHEAPSPRLLARLREQADLLGANLITTQKDWFRLTPQQRGPILAYPVRMQFDNPDALNRLLADSLPPRSELS